MNTVEERFAIDTTCFHNKEWRTFIPSKGAKSMSEPICQLSEEDRVRPIFADGYEVFWWPEFQALTKRLGLDTQQEITRVTIDVPIDGIVHITTETLGKDSTKKR